MKQIMILNIMELIVDDEVIQSFIIPDPVTMDVMISCIHPSNVELLKSTLEIATKCCFASTDDGVDGYD